MLRRPPYAAITLAASVALLASCNSVSGINDIKLVPVIVPVAADGVTINEIAVYQGPKRGLKGGAPGTPGVMVPVVAGRAALVRVFVTVDDSYDKSPVTARLVIGDAAPIELVTTPVSSTEEDIASTLNFEVPGDLLKPGVAYHVELTQPSDHASGDNKAARHPESGDEDMGVTSSGAQLKLVLVPVKYGADGSNRLPDISETQIQGYKDAFYKTYPTPKVELEVHEPMQWNKTISPSGAGWGEILDAIAQFRQKNNAPPETYYFGIFSPKATFDQYCQSGCVAGLAMVGSPSDTYTHAGVGVGFTGYMAFSTAIHEVGHTQGREHADCGGAQQIDPNFPHPNAGVGVWGFDLVARTLISPTQGKDMMGYCDPYWISDYTYEAIFQQMKLVNNARTFVPEGMKNLEWERARVGMDGELVWLDPVIMELPPRGEPLSVTVHGPSGSQTRNGQFFPYDHIPGGVILWQKDPSPIAGIQVTLQGQVKSLVK